MNDLPNPFSALANSLAKQGLAFDKPLSDSSQYCAYLSTAEKDEDTGLWSVMFEMVPYEWALNVLAKSSQEVNYVAPVGPNTCYHIPAVTESDLLNVLKLDNTDDVAPGSWYLLRLQKQDSGKVNGILYDPDIDMEPNS